MNKIAELPVTMDQMGPMVDVKIEGTPARMIADSGAFFSVISPGSAQALHLSTSAGPQGLSMRSISGTASISVAVVKTFTLAGVDIPHVQFIVGGSEVHGAGVIGQNVFGIGDVEYDLPHGAIRLMKSSGCGKVNLAYWANGRSYSLIPISARSAQLPHTIGTVYVNGTAIRATFDTGAATSMLSLAAAARAGIKPDNPGVADGGIVWGFGRKQVRTWIAPIGSFTVGDGEKIEHARIRFGAIEGDIDMLIGADFFIAHRVYVDNREHRLFLTYEGGPIFNIKAHSDGPAPPPGTPLPGTAVVSAPLPAESYAREGAVAMARNDLDTAIADFSKAIALAPTEPHYLDQRSEAYFRQNKIASGRADLDRVIELKPTDLQALLARAAFKLRDHDRSGALADLDAADQAAEASAMERLPLGGLFVEAGEPQRAVAAFDPWIKLHPVDVRRPAALNGRCWARALSGKDLDAALHDCDAALHLQPHTAAYLDSRGTVQLRRGELAKAISDYDAALALSPNLSWSLYGRGIAKRRAGNMVGGSADIAAAVAIRPDIAEYAKRCGFEP
ncbi:aspartyl protease family protein [Sphingosinicellaceae bacterium]|nr:aspartyl protease family protein [Sphingosinicellaceae bacterium]